MSEKNKSGPHYQTDVVYRWVGRNVKATAAYIGVSRPAVMRLLRGEPARDSIRKKVATAFERAKAQIQMTVQAVLMAQARWEAVVPKQALVGDKDKGMRAIKMIYEAAPSMAYGALPPRGEDSRVVITFDMAHAFLTPNGDERKTWFLLRNTLFAFTEGDPRKRAIYCYAVGMALGFINGRNVATDLRRDVCAILDGIQARIDAHRLEWWKRDEVPAIMADIWGKVW